MRLVLALVALLMVPAMTMGAASISVTSGGAAARDVAPGVAISIPIEINVSIPTPFTVWDGALDASAAGYSLTNRVVSAPFSNASAWWGNAEVLDPQPIPTLGLGFLKASAGNQASFNGATQTFTLNGPALAAGQKLTLSMVPDPNLGLMFYKSPDTDYMAFDTIGSLVITGTPEPVSLLLLGLGGLFLRRRG